MPEDSDTITISVRGTNKNKQYIVSRICKLMEELAIQLGEELEGTQWGLLLESSREPEL